MNDVCAGAPRTIRDDLERQLCSQSRLCRRDEHSWPKLAYPSFVVTSVFAVELFRVCGCCDDSLDLSGGRCNACASNGCRSPVEMQPHSQDGNTTGIERSRQNLALGLMGESELQIKTDTLSFRTSS